VEWDYRELAELAAEQEFKAAQAMSDLTLDLALESSTQTAPFAVPDELIAALRSNYP
jgi:hypothetical protein